MMTLNIVTCALALIAAANGTETVFVPEDITFIAGCDGTTQRYVQVLPH